MWKWEADEQPKAVVAILHSVYEQHKWYAWLIAKLRSNGFHVVMGDLPGHGEQSKKSRYHDEEFTDYYKHMQLLMTVAKEYELPIFIIGNGLGATIAQRMLQKGKVECAGVVLTSPWQHLKLHPGKMVTALSTLGSLTANMKMKHEIPISLLTRNGDAYVELKDDRTEKLGVTVQWYREYQNVIKRLKDTEQLYPNVPTLMMVGGQDQVIDIVAAKQWLLAQRLTEFQFKEWTLSNHGLYFEVEREDVFAYTKDFMNNVVRSLGYVVE